MFCWRKKITHDEDEGYPESWLQLSWALALPISSSAGLGAASSPVVPISCSKPLSYSLSPGFSIPADDLSPLLRKFMPLDLMSGSVRGLCYKQQNPIWLNTMFVRSYFAIQRISGRTWGPLESQFQPGNGGCDSKHQCWDPNLSVPHVLMMLTTRNQKSCSCCVWRDKHSSLSCVRTWNPYVPTSLCCFLPSQHLVQEHLTDGS